MGSGKLINTAKLSHVFSSPRVRAQNTLDMLLGDETKNALMKEGKLTITKDIAEWDYGDYEGLTTRDIQAKRKERGLDKEKAWDIWVDGCAGGE